MCRLRIARDRLVVTVRVRVVWLPAASVRTREVRRVAAPHRAALVVPLVIVVGLLVIVAVLLFIVVGLLVIVATST